MSFGPVGCSGSERCCLRLDSASALAHEYKQIWAGKYSNTAVLATVPSAAQV